MCIGRAGDERGGLRGAVGCVSGSPQRGLGKVLRSVHDTSKRGVERESISIEV